MLYLCIILSLICIFIARKSYKELCPGKLFTYYWAGQILLFIIGGYGYLQFKYSGILFILLCVLTFNLGANLFNSRKKNKTLILKKSRICFNDRKLLQIVVISNLLGFISPIYDLISHGFDLSGLFDLSTVLEMNNGMSVERYSGEEKTGGIFIKLLSVFGCLSPLLGGFVINLVPIKKEKLLCIIALLPALFGSLTQGAKMGIITSVFLFFSGYIVCGFLNNRTPKFKIKYFVGGVLGAMLFFSILLTSMMFRIGKFDIDTFSIVTVKFISYAFGHLPAFDIWFDKQDILTDSMSFGGKMFMGITNFLGIMKREQGLYQEFITISNMGDETNVFTIFRIFIDDFGIIGTPLFCFFLGAFFQNAYIKCRCLINYKISTIILICFYCMIFWSFATSIFVYTTFIVTFIMFYVILTKYSHKVPL